MREVDPQQTPRAMSYQLYIDAPMPMVTIFKTVDVTRLVRLSRKGFKLNLLLCYCVAAAADQVPEFRLLPVGKKLMEYDHIGVNVIVANRSGGISSCDIPFQRDLRAFARSYEELTAQVRDSGENHDLEDYMIVGTSSLAHYDVDGAVNFYSGIFNNPFLIWGKYRRRGLRKLLKLSFQFHHVQMDGQEACRFLSLIQQEIDRIPRDLSLNS